jgi:hypothetical protein
MLQYAISEFEYEILQFLSPWIKLWQLDYLTKKIFKNIFGGQDKSGNILN